tara:strand:- start:901 stop:4956 length:4056 start_codon:yes stop_codon:yes gene_type:complete
MSNARFIDAVENNNIDIVLQMIDEVKGNPEGLYKLLTSRNGLLRFTPLMIAVRRDYIEISKILLDAGSIFKPEQHVNLTSRAGNSSLWNAVNNENIVLIELLISFGADVNVRNNTGTYIIDSAIRSGNKEIVRMLVEAGATMRPLRIFNDIVEDNFLKISPEELERLLSESLIDLDEIDKSEMIKHNILTHILDIGNEKILWDPFNDFNRSPKEKQEMIDKFIMIFDILIKNGIDVNFKTSDGWTALEFLLEFFPIEMNEVLVPMLLNAGAYLTIDRVNYPEIIKNIKKLSERIKKEIPIKGIKTIDDIRESSIELSTKEFVSNKKHKRRLDELIKTLNDTHDRFDQTYMPLDKIIEQIFLTKQIRCQMMKLIFPDENYKMGVHTQREEPEGTSHISDFFKKHREISKSISQTTSEQRPMVNPKIHIGQIIKLMLPFFEALSEEYVHNDEPEPENDQPQNLESIDENRNIETVEIKYDKKKGEHITKVIRITNYADRVKSLKNLQKVNKTFDINEKITQIDDILSKLSEKSKFKLSLISSRQYLLDLIHTPGNAESLLLDSFKDLRYLFEFHNEIINGDMASMSHFYGFVDYTSKIPSLNSNTIWLLQLLTFKTVHQKEIMNMGLVLCLDLLKDKPTTGELDIIQKTIKLFDTQVSESMSETTWGEITEELLKDAKGSRLVEKILENFSRIGILETLLNEEFVIEDRIYTSGEKPVVFDVVSKSLYDQGNDHYRRPELYNVELLKEELLSHNRANPTINDLLASVRVDQMAHRDECALRGSHIVKNDYVELESQLLNICFDLKRSLCQCTAVFIHNKDQEQRKEVERLNDLDEGIMKVILERKDIENKSLEELLDIAKAYGTPDEKLLRMIHSINYAADNELPFIKDYLLNYILSYGPKGDRSEGTGLQPEILRQRLLDSYKREVQVIESRKLEKNSLRFRMQPELESLGTAISVRYKGSEGFSGRKIFLKAINHCRPYIQEVQMLVKLSRKDAISVEVSMQPFLHKKALEKLSEIKKIKLSELKTTLKKSSLNDQLRTEIKDKMCELSATGEYKLLTPAQRILSLKPSDKSQLLASNILNKDNKLEDIEEGDLEFSSSSSSTNPDDLYYGYPEELDTILDIGSIKQMINEVLFFRDDPLNPEPRYGRDPLKIFLKFGLDLENDRELINKLYDFFYIQEYTRFNDIPPPAHYQTRTSEERLRELQQVLPTTLLQELAESPVDEILARMNQQDLPPGYVYPEVGPPQVDDLLERLSRLQGNHEPVPEQGLLDNADDAQIAWGMNATMDDDHPESPESERGARRRTIKKKKRRLKEPLKEILDKTLKKKVVKNRNKSHIKKRNRLSNKKPKKN